MLVVLLLLLHLLLSSCVGCLVILWARFVVVRLVERLERV